jgi:hypothetical protein
MGIEEAKIREQLYLISLDIKDKYFERAIGKINEMLVMNPNRAELHYELGKNGL